MASPLPSGKGVLRNKSIQATTPIGVNYGGAKPASEAAFASLNSGAQQATQGFSLPFAAPNRQMGAQPATPAQPSPSSSASSPQPSAPYSPTTDLTPGQSENYQDWFANNDNTGQQIQELAQQQAAQGNRKAAYLASMSGGNGGFYQSGQIAAGIAGQQTMNQGLLSNAQARGQIYTNKAAALGSLGMGAQGYGNANALQTGSQNFQAGQNDIERAREDAKAKTDATTGGLQTQRATSDNKLESHFKDNPNSDAYNDYNQISVQIDQAIGAGNFELAQQLQDQLNNFAWGDYRSDGHRK